MLYIHVELNERIRTVGYENITLTLNSRKGLKLLWVCKWQAETGRRRQTAILTDNFLAALCYLQSLAPSFMTRRTRLFLAGVSSSLPLLPPRFSIYRLNCPPQAETGSRLRLCISRGHLHISFHNTHTLPFGHVTVSAYSHRCDLWRESLIDGSVKGQDAHTFHDESYVH